MTPAAIERPLLMGILNVTPDSFSDGGLHVEPAAAVAHALEMVAAGADLIDIGGESTRPGSASVAPAEQLRRVLPVLEQLRGRLPKGVEISIDTASAEVAAAAVAAGAAIINDISAGRGDPGMFDLARARAVPLILMHMQGTPRTMQQDPSYTDVVAEVRDFLLERAAAAIAAGVPREAIVIDPGIGFGKTRDHNLALLAGLGELTATGYPVLLGTSRKRFMGAICGSAQPDELVGATAATTALGVRAGVKIFRVHDVRQNRQALDVAWAVLRSGRGSPPARSPQG